MRENEQIEEMAKDIACKTAWDEDEIPTINCLETAKRLYIAGYRKQEWISVEERYPLEFVSVLGHMTDAGLFPSVRECYRVGNAFFFPALNDRHPISHWMPLPEPPKEGGE